MSKGKCYRCGGYVVENPKSFQCNKCGLTVWKEKSGRNINQSLAITLFTHGRTTDVINGFTSKAGKKFSAGLQFNSAGKLIFWFPEKNKAKSNHSTQNADTQNSNAIQAKIRVESNQSGSSYIAITGPFNKDLHVEYGLVPAREAECLALITALNIIKHRAPKVSNISISCNNLDIARYLLRERSPRDRTMQYNMKYLHTLLARYPKWDIKYFRRHRHKLKGSSRASKFPRGAFPWLVVKATRKDNHILVQLPPDPAVLKQFTATFYAASQVENQDSNKELCYTLPTAAEKMFKTWLETITAS